METNALTKSVGKGHVAMRIGLVGTSFGTAIHTNDPHNLKIFFPDINFKTYSSWVPVFPSTILEQAMQVLGHADAALTAVDDGCDAVIIDSVGDYGLAVMRDILSVPAIGPGEVGIAEVSRNNRRFGIVTVWPESMNFILRDRLVAARCESLCVGIVNVGIERGSDRLSGPHGYLAQVRNGQRSLVRMIQGGIAELVTNGAEAVMLGCTCMHGLSEFVSAAAQIPVVNPLVVAIDTARKTKPLSQRPEANPEHRRLLRNMVDAVAHEQIGGCPVWASPSP